MTFICPKEKKKPRDEYAEYIAGQLKDEYKPKAERLKRNQELMELVKKLFESGHVSNYGADDSYNGDDSEEKPFSSNFIDLGIDIAPPEKRIAVIGERASLEDTSSDDDIGEKTSPEDKLSHDDIGEKQGSLSDTPAAVSEEKLLHDKKRKSIALSLGHISMKNKKMKIDEDIGVAFQDKKVIDLATRGIGEKMASLEKVLKTMERILLSWNSNVLGFDITPPEKPVAVIGEKASPEDTSSDHEIGEKTSSEDTSFDDDIGGKQGLLSDTPAAVSEEKLLHDKKLKSFVLSFGHISMKNKKLKIDEDIDLAVQDKVIALATRVIFQKLASCEEILDIMERILFSHMSKVSDLFSSDDL